MLLDEAHYFFLLHFCFPLESIHEFFCHRSQAYLSKDLFFVLELMGHPRRGRHDHPCVHLPEPMPFDNNPFEEWDQTYDHDSEHNVQLGLERLGRPYLLNLPSHPVS